jgi:hypothetical protein
MKAKTRIGWRDAAFTPAEVAAYFDRQASMGNPAGPVILCRIKLAGGVKTESQVELDGGASKVLDELSWFLYEARQAGVVEASITFTHAKAMKPESARVGGVEGRPASREVEAEPLAAFSQFLTAVADSVHPSGTNGAWSSCEWASFELTPAA